MAHGLSKSRLLNFRQCAKRLWLHVYRPGLEEFSDAARMLFQRGFGVGEVARSLYPDGIRIDSDNPAQALAETRRMLQQTPDRPIFEAAFAHDGVLVRADVLVPEGGGYRMFEVKASAKVKPYHRMDCAVQAWVCQQAGLPISRVELAHVDTMP